MKKTNIVIISLILFILGCEDTKTQKPHITVENTTEIFTPKETTQHNQNHTQKQNDDSIEENIHEVIKESFELNTLQQHDITINIENKHISTDTITTPLLLISLFNTQSNKYTSQLPDLIELQNKYKNRLTVLTVLVNQEEKEEVLKKYSDLSDMYYFFTNKKENERFIKTVMKIIEIKDTLTLPLSILYKEGNYYIHYEGSTPIEMIEHNINEAIH